MKLRLAYVLASAMVLGAQALAAGQTSRGASAHREIHPGRAIGSLRLGMSRAEAVRAMGRPRETHRIDAATSELRWYAGRIEREDQDIPYLAAWFREGRAIQLEVTSSEYTTTRGIGTRSTLGQIRAAYPEIVALEYTGPGERAVYFDSRQLGICFHFETSDKVTEQAQPASIIVHPAGRDVKVQPGLQPVRPPRRAP